MPLILKKALFRVRYLLVAHCPDTWEPGEIPSWVKYVEAYTAAEALETARLELQLSRREATRRTLHGVPVLSVEEI